MMTKANKPHALDAATALWSQVGSHWRGVGDLRP